MSNNHVEFLFCQVFERDLHLTNERKEHILIRHPELRSFKEEFQQACHTPDFLLKKSTGEILLVRWYSQIFNGKFMVVVVRTTPERIWIVTAFLSRKKPIGELYENIFGSTDI